MGCGLIPPTFTIDTHQKKEVIFWWCYWDFCGLCELLSKSTALLLFQASNIWTISCCFFATLYHPGLKIVCMTQPLEIMNLQRRLCARAISVITLTINFTPAFKGDCSACPGDQNLSFHSFLQVQFSGLAVHIKWSNCIPVAGKFSWKIQVKAGL